MHPTHPLPEGPLDVKGVPEDDQVLLARRVRKALLQEMAQGIQRRARHGDGLTGEDTQADGRGSPAGKCMGQYCNTKAIWRQWTAAKRPELRLCTFQGHG